MWQGEQMPKERTHKEDIRSKATQDIEELTKLEK